MAGTATLRSGVVQRGCGLMAGTATLRGGDERGELHFSSELSGEFVEGSLDEGGSSGGVAIRHVAGEEAIEESVNFLRGEGVVPWEGAGADGGGESLAVDA
jgi:hypothetical protein